MRRTPPRSSADLLEGRPAERWPAPAHDTHNVCMRVAHVGRTSAHTYALAARGVGESGPAAEINGLVVVAQDYLLNGTGVPGPWANRLAAQHHLLARHPWTLANHLCLPFDAAGRSPG